MTDQLLGFAQTLLVIMGIALLIATVGIALLYRRIRRIQLPPDADFFTTVRHLPLSFVLVLDLLDFGLDMLAAPVAWLLLEHLGLRALRNKAAVEALIPLTQAIPTFTIAWFAARTLDLGTPPGRRYGGRKPVVIIDQ
jgi:hypothetical protein